VWTGARFEPGLAIKRPSSTLPSSAMSYTDYENKVCVDPKTVVEEGLSIFDYQSQCIDMGLHDNTLIVRYEDMDEISFDTVLSKKEVNVLIASLTKMYETMED
jgi:hypothetical protein